LDSELPHDIHPLPLITALIHPSQLIYKLVHGSGDSPSESDLEESINLSLYVGFPSEVVNPFQLMLKVSNRRY